MYIGNIYTDTCSPSVYYSNMGYKPCWYDTASGKLCLHLIINSSIPNSRFSCEGGVTTGGDWFPTTVDHSPGAWPPTRCLYVIEQDFSQLYYICNVFSHNLLNTGSYCMSE